MLCLFLAKMATMLPKVGLLTCVRATATLSLALLLVGELYLGDISVPPSVYARLGVKVPDDLFTSDAILRLS